MKYLYFFSLCFLLSACGVKGDPKPPLLNFEKEITTPLNAEASKKPKKTDSKKKKKEKEND